MKYVLLAFALLLPRMAVADSVKVTIFTYDFSKTYLVEYAGKALVIDPGGINSAKELASDLRDHGVDPRALKSMIVTHGHADHAGAAGYFQKTYGVPVIAGAGDLKLLQNGRNDRLCPTGAFARNRLPRDQAARFPGFTPDTLVSSPMALNGFPLRIIPLPGHTQGSLVITAGNAVFVGDLFRGSLTFSARRHFYMCDLPDNVADIQTLLKKIAPNGQTFYPGHFPPAPRRAVERLARILAEQG